MGAGRPEAGAGVSEPSVDQDPRAGLRTGNLADPKRPTILPTSGSIWSRLPSGAGAGPTSWGPKWAATCGASLGDHAMRNLRKAQAVLRLAESHPAATLDQACRLALRFDNVRFASLKQIGV